MAKSFCPFQRKAAISIAPNGIFGRLVKKTKRPGKKGNSTTNKRDDKEVGGKKTTTIKTYTCNITTTTQQQQLDYDTLNARNAESSPKSNSASSVIE
jgi:hypothetical protein